MNKTELLKSLKDTASEMIASEELSNFAKTCISRKINALNKNSTAQAIERTLNDIILITKMEVK